MSGLSGMKAYLDSAQYEEKRCQCMSGEKAQNPFVTISREAGAGGHTLAEAILREMASRQDPLLQGWQVLDQEICRKVSDEPGLQVSLRTLVGYEYQSQIADMINQLIVGDSPQDVVIKKLFSVIRSCAAFGKVVIVGRGGAFLTRDFPLGTHIRLVASSKTRIARMASLLKVDEKKAAEIVKEQDRERERLVKNFFNKDIKNPLAYDAVWNTDTVPISMIARSVVDLAESKPCCCRAAGSLRK